MRVSVSGLDNNGMENLGQRLRTVRQAQNLTLREVARRTNLTASLISQVERGLAKPSVASLHAMAEVLGLSMDYFFDTKRVEVTPFQAASPVRLSSEHPPVLHAAERRIVNIAGGLQLQDLFPENDQSVKFLEMHFDVGASSGDQAYIHHGFEYGVVLEGRLLVELGSNQHVIETGDSISFDCSIPHKVINVGDIPAVAIWLSINQ